ncbi:MAG: RNA-binding protein [Alphaproteobacteria bacterium]
MQALTDKEGMRTRRCIVSGEVLPEAELIRFVAGPEARIVPDILARLPGRGLWVRASREAIAKAAAKNLFARAAGADVQATADLTDRTEKLLAAHMLETLGMARRAGALITGFEKIEAALRSANPPALIMEASDAAGDGRRKLQDAARASGHQPFVIGCFSREELGLAAGLENMVHAGLRPGRFVERLLFDAGRLRGFRPLDTWDLGVRSGCDRQISGRKTAPVKDRNG